MNEWMEYAIPDHPHRTRDETAQAITEICRRYPGETSVMLLFLHPINKRNVLAVMFLPAYVDRESEALVKDIEAYRQSYDGVDRLKAMPYPEYLQSSEWRATRARKLYSVGNRCQVCNSATPPLEVHHRTYEHLGAEPDEDLTALCHECHTLFHTARRI